MCPLRTRGRVLTTRSGPASSGARSPCVGLGFEPGCVPVRSAGARRAAGVDRNRPAVGCVAYVAFQGPLPLSLLVHRGGLVTRDGDQSTLAASIVEVRD